MAFFGTLIIISKGKFLAIIGISECILKLNFLFEMNVAQQTPDSLFCLTNGIEYFLDKKKGFKRQFSIASPPA